MRGYELGLFVLAVLVGPMLLTVGILWIVQWRERRLRRRSPLTEKLHHGPGQQLRAQIDELKDRFDENLVKLVMIGPSVALITLLPWVPWQSVSLRPINWMAIATGVAMSALFIVRIIRLRSDLRRRRSGMRGEMSVAQELDKLMAQGCAVFHDIPAQAAARKFNLDHVVVTPSAVYMVETKWRSKRGEGKTSAEAYFDGESVALASGKKEVDALVQAAAGANWLSKYLAGETGQFTPVLPVVALPGWFVKPLPTEQAAEVKVLNPKRFYMLLKDGRAAIHPSQRNRIINALIKRYPELED